MNMDKEWRQALHPLLKQPHADRWPAIRQAVSQHNPGTIIATPHHAQLCRRLVACAAALLLFIGVLLQNGSTVSLPPVVQSGGTTEGNVEPTNRDSIQINEVNGVHTPSYFPTIPENIQKETLSLDSMLSHLGYDIQPCVLPTDISFRTDILEGNPLYLVYDSDGTLISHPLYNVFVLVYTGQFDFTRRIVLSCSKTTVPDSEMRYVPKNNDGIYQTSTINNHEVKIGHLMLDDIFEGHTEKIPTERYIADFTVAGIHTRVVADNLSLEEFLTTVKSIIR